MGIEIFNTGVYLSLPPAHLFRLPPNPEPRALPPPPLTDEWTLKSPLAISPEFYNRVLEPQVPITFALGYFCIVTLWNQANRKRGWRPWGISQTRSFKDFTLIHNVLLAIYSAFTFAGMCRAMWVSTPGWFSGAPVVHQVDALCKMQGPRGFGDAVSYDSASARWAVKNQAIHLGAGDLAPDPTDVGRIWNEGLAFWGWLFYLSKFYEVVDTIIALLKGKRATTLQTFHHFGAMFAMWAGMRYMSVPIWMFVIINSFIHTLMYTFYALSVLGRKVDPRLKRALTTLQILQFVLGIFYASAHLFIEYEVPVSLPYKAVSILSDPATASHAASDFWSSALEVGRSSGTLPAWAKRIIYRAVGAEGLAESVRDSHIYTDRQAHLRHTSPNKSSSPFESPAGTNYGHSTQSEMVRCIDTEGQTFAVWLNVVYLMPLMGLFMRFFVKSYLRKNDTAAEDQRNANRRFSNSVNEAARRTSDVLEGLGTQTEEAVDDAAEEAEKSAESVSEKVKSANANDTSDASTKASKVGELARDSTADVMRSLKEKSQRLKKMAKDSALGDSYVEVIEKMRQGAMQAAGTKDSSDAEDEPMTNGHDDEGDTSTTSALATEDEPASTAASSTDADVKDEIHDKGDASNILTRKNSDPSMAEMQGSKK